MYSITMNNNSFHIKKDGQYLLKDITPVVCFESGQQISMQARLKENGIATDTYIIGKIVLEYLNEDKNISLKIMIEPVNNTIIISVELEVGHKFSEIPDMLSPIGAIKLLISKENNVNKYLANHLNGLFWTRSYFDCDLTKIPNKTQMLLMEKNDSCLYVLPICNGSFKTEINGYEKGMEIAMSGYMAGQMLINGPMFSIGVSKEPYSLINEVTWNSLQYRNGYVVNSYTTRYPEQLEYLGWCSWDAFYDDINESGIYEKADEFKKLGLPVKWFVIDSGWSDLTKDSCLNSLKPDSHKFPNGFKPLIHDLKHEYGLKWVGVWHAFLGAWNGVNKKSELALELKDCLYMTSKGRLIPSPKDGKAFCFWNKWHKYLKSQGVDFVKVDGQSSLLNFVNNEIPVAKAAKELHESLEASVGIHFDNALINCMGMASENIWNRRSSVLSRNSDDFYPLKTNNFEEHAFQNVYNSVYHSPFIRGDWDMWWSNHSNALQHSVLRCLSGGPIYLSDKVGATIVEAIWPLILKDGRILRCDGPGLPTMDCLLVDTLQVEMPLKVWNRIGETGVVGAFHINLNGISVKGDISPSDIPDLKGDKFVVYEHFTRKINIMEYKERMDLELNKEEVALFLVIPMREGFAYLGLINKYLSPATIISQRRIEEKRVLLEMIDSGNFSFISDKNVKEIKVNGSETRFRKEDILYTVSLAEASSQIVEIQLT